MRRVVVATTNSGKIKEIRELLGSLPIELVSMGELWFPLPQIEETGSTFLQNAMIKADYVFDKSGFWSLADDSGLEVDALHGRPGVYSARYAGPNAGASDNNRKLLDELQTADMAQRTARFRCAIVLKTAPNTYIEAQGVCEGKIGFEPAGSEGFGYDPLFIPDGFDRTFAQLSSIEKHQLSHRGKALNALVEKIDALFK